MRDPDHAELVSGDTVVEFNEPDLDQIISRLADDRSFGDVVGRLGQITAEGDVDAIAVILLTSRGDPVLQVGEETRSARRDDPSVWV